MREDMLVSYGKTLIANRVIFQSTENPDEFAKRKNATKEERDAAVRLWLWVHSLDEMALLRQFKIHYGH